MRPVNDFPNVHQQAVELTARLQQLILLSGTGTREALWAVQMLERRAAVARWRSGEFPGKRAARRMRTTAAPRT